MATLSDLRTTLALKVRDTGNATFSTTELDDLINQGIDAYSSIRPREIVTTIGTVASGTLSYAASSYTYIYRLDIYSSAGSYRATMPPGYGDGPNSGWELHGGVVYLPPSWTLTDGDTLRAYGYAAHIQLSASTATTDLDTAGINAVMVWAQMEAFQRLIADRAKFQQWQADTNNTDVTLIQLASLSGQAMRRWEMEKQRRRAMRKLG